jgi:membrane protein YqaA with SNARE-associated domain
MIVGWLLATAGTALLGSIVPVVNIEVYLLGVLSVFHGLPWWALALAATVGQLAGKTLFFLAGSGGVRLGERLTRMTKAKQGGKITEWLERFQRMVEQRPWWGRVVLFVGAIVDVPPFTLMSFVSGAAGLPLIGYLGVSFAGRALHFLLIAGAPELFRQLPAIFG